MSLHRYIIGVVEVIVHPGYKAEFDRMGNMLGTLIHNSVPLRLRAVGVGEAGAARASPLFDLPTFCS